MVYPGQYLELRISLLVQGGGGAATTATVSVSPKLIRITSTPISGLETIPLYGVSKEDLSYTSHVKIDINPPVVTIVHCRSGGSTH